MGQVKDGLPAETPAFVSAIWRLIGAIGGMQYGLAGSGARMFLFTAFADLALWMTQRKPSS